MLKTFLSLAAFLLGFLPPQDAHAVVSAKLLTVTVKRSAPGLSVDLVFDRPVAARSLRPGFERDFVQIPLRATRMDSARMLAAQDSEVQKVFVYPYTADTARLRLILKRDSQWAKGRVSVWNNNPKSVRVFIKEQLASRATAEAPTAAAAPAADGKAAQKSAPPVRLSVGKAPAAAPIIPPGGAPPVVTTGLAAPTTEEKKILSEVVGNTHDIDINNPDSVKAALSTAPPAPAVSGVDKLADKPIEQGPVGISADPTRHFTRMAAALLGVLALFIGGALLVKRYAGKLKKLPFGKKERLIQVVATHYLGAKKSISLVKVTGEYMVVGVSNDGISLITKLAAETNVDQYLEDRFWGGTFEKHLDSYSKDAVSAKQIDLSSYDGVKDLATNVKDEVKLESPVRASIREKLTKLKPLA